MQVTNQSLKLLENKDGTFTLDALISRSMSNSELMKEYEQICKQATQAERKFESLEKEIADGNPQKLLEQYKEEFERIRELRDQFKYELGDILEALKKELSKEVKKLKKKKNYKRADKNTKIQIKNQILAEVITPRDIEVDSEIAQELRKEFDSL